MNWNYNKLIVSGSMLEEYKYENRPKQSNRTRFSKRSNVYTGMGNDRSIPSETQRLGKRQDSANRSKMAFERLCSANFGGSEIPVFGTFTFKEEQSLQNGYKLFKLFIQRLRQKFGTHFRYIAVPERGTKKTKRLHFHTLFWGLPLELVKSERQDRTYAKIWKYGFIDLIITDNNPKVGFYLAKYLKKSFLDINFLNQKSYICSRNIIRPEIYTSLTELVKEEILGVVENYQLLDQKHYDTLHLGRCNYKIYKKI